MTVLRKTDPIMYSVRWLQQYQHSFMRPGKEDITKLFIQLQEKQRNQDLDNWEHVYVEGIFPNPSGVVEEFPVTLYDTTNEQMCEIIYLDKLKQNGRLPLRGRIDTQHVDEKVNTNKCNSQSIELFLSQETLDMRQLDQSIKKKFIITVYNNFN